MGAYTAIVARAELNEQKRPARICASGAVLLPLRTIA